MVLKWTCLPQSEISNDGNLYPTQHCKKTSYVFIDDSSNDLIFYSRRHSTRRTIFYGSHSWQFIPFFLSRHFKWLVTFRRQIWKQICLFVLKTIWYPLPHSILQTNYFLFLCRRHCDRLNPLLHTSYTAHAHSVFAQMTLQTPLQTTFQETPCQSWVLTLQCFSADDKMIYLSQIASRQSQSDHNLSPFSLCLNCWMEDVRFH